MTHLRRAHHPECQVRRLAAVWARSTERLTTGAVPPLHPPRSPVGATDRPTLQTVSTHSSLGILREAVASTRGEVRPEAVASRSSVVVGTTGMDSRVAAGGGHGAAGEHLNPDVHKPRETTRLTTFFSLAKHIPSTSSSFNVVVVKMSIVVQYEKTIKCRPALGLKNN